MKTYPALSHPLPPAKPICTFCQSTAIGMHQMRGLYICEFCADNAHLAYQRERTRNNDVRAADDRTLFRARSA